MPSLIHLKNKIKMKNFKVLSLLFVMFVFAFAACKNEGGSTAAEETKVEPATTTTTTSSTTTNPANANEPAVPAGPITTIDAIDATYDFGEVMEGEKVVHNYEIKNTGDEPLIISNAKGSCGCTVPDWPREPIAPGETATIKVQFDTKGKGKVGGNLQSKRVTVTANTDPVNTYLTIKGKVNKEETAETAPAQ